jgi:hypothetical protein
MMRRLATFLVGALLVGLVPSCSLIVDVGDLAHRDAEAGDVDGAADADAEADADADADADAEAEADADADADADVEDDGPGTDADADADVDADAEEADEVDADADADADADEDADADADVDADVVVGPPARVLGELTTTGAIPAPTGCVASGTGFCLRSDSTDPGATEMTGTGFRLRGIVVEGGSR